MESIEIVALHNSADERIAIVRPLMQRQDNYNELNNNNYIFSLKKVQNTRRFTLSISK